MKQLEQGQEGLLILDSTPFYAESGGQVGDTGSLENESSRITVADTQKAANQYHVHQICVDQGCIREGEMLTARVDSERRQSIILNHSATHLLHAAMHSVLGDHVQQKGSLVAPDRLRFDFSHPQPVTDDEIRQIEALVNQQIRINTAADARQMSYDDAIGSGAMALFGEKYGDEVRVLSIGEFSTELCGGTHVERAGDIGLFRITSEGGIASGVRRIEAVTGEAAMAWVTGREDILRDSASRVKTTPDKLVDRLGQLLDRNRELEKQLKQLQQKMASQSGSDLIDTAETVGDLKVVAAVLDNHDIKQLRETVDRLKDKLDKGVVLLGTANDGKVSLIAGVTKNAVDRVRAGDLVNFVAEQVGGRGGGRPDMAQAGGSQPENLPQAIASVVNWVERAVA